MRCKNSSTDCISAAQIRWNSKRLFSSDTGIFSRSWVEKKKETPGWENWIDSFIEESRTLRNQYFFKCPYVWIINDIHVIFNMKYAVINPDNMHECQSNPCVFMKCRT